MRWWSLLICARANCSGSAPHSQSREKNADAWLSEMLSAPVPVCLSNDIFGVDHRQRPCGKRAGSVTRNAPDISRSFDIVIIFLRDLHLRRGRCRLRAGKHAALQIHAPRCFAVVQRVRRGPRCAANSFRLRGRCSGKYFVASYAPFKSHRPLFPRRLPRFLRRLCHNNRSGRCRIITRQARARARVGALPMASS